MPIYEYKCKKCEKIFDVFQSIGGSSEGLICPVCGEPNPQRIFSAFGTSGTIGGHSSGATGCSSSGPFS
ncbi:MAG: zinc ribbon domain-containing protein [candidate division KSB1 bacterium]|nr:zinc ribbon domain-containing protein [candidate division KSB1 bacterium]MDZ7335294.1 zinc ribbon domain-containing protein [candidate division KSB1 bacterium]MDZ7357218.1 zinc ribbon domain-containing protein [candidate division KSB1 bacterium]MDZ7399093.1 zinc ribbon domain-containing protein [candidate division KSB1 bacterium]